MNMKRYADRGMVKLRFWRFCATQGNIGTEVIKCQVQIIKFTTFEIIVSIDKIDNYLILQAPNR